MGCMNGREAWWRTGEAVSMLGLWGDLSRGTGQVSGRTPGRRGLLGKEAIETVSREGTQMRTNTLPMS